MAAPSSDPINVTEPEPDDNLTASASTMSLQVSSGRSESGRQSISTASVVPSSIGGKIRKNLDKKKQSRPKNAEMRPDQRPTTAAPVPQVKEESGPEIPRRKSLLEYIEGDLVKSGQKSVLFRFLAIGSHEQDPEDFLVLHEKIVEVINTACYDEPLTGYLIVYPKHFTHMLEGSELSLNKYIAICAELFQGFRQPHVETDYHPKPDPDHKFQIRMVILNYALARERYTTEWYHVVHYSPSHRGMMHFHGFRKRLYEFIKNFWVMSGVLAESYAKNVVIFSEDPLEASLEAMEEKELYRSIQEKLYTLYPGTDMLNYLLKIKKRSPPLRTPKEHIEKYWTVPNIILDSEITWPVPCRLAPYH